MEEVDWFIDMLLAMEADHILLSFEGCKTDGALCICFVGLVPFRQLQEAGPLLGVLLGELVEIDLNSINIEHPLSSPDEGQTLLKEVDLPAAATPYDQRNKEIE